MNDTIYRQDAIDALKAMVVPLHLDSACEDIWERDRILDKAIDVMHGLPPAEPKKTLTFSERKKIVREYQDWCLSNNAADCAESFLAYLSIKGFING